MSGDKIKLIKKEVVQPMQGGKFVCDRCGIVEDRMFLIKTQRTTHKLTLCRKCVPGGW